MTTAAPPAKNHPSNQNKKYTSVVFAAYVVPTIPALTREVGDPDGAGYVGGKYVGFDDPEKDIAARFRLVQAAAEQVYDLSTETRDDQTVLHIFVCPEFFFRGPNGAYQTDPTLRDFVAQLARDLADRPKFANWMFVFGTLLVASSETAASSETRQKAKLRDDLVQAIVRSYDAASDDETKDFVFGLLTQATEFAQSHPLVQVHNRCFVYKQNSFEWPHGLCIEKRFVSHEDFVISYYSPDAYSEMSVAYPYVDESFGEIKKEVFDSKSIFTLDGITFAVEICLDHRRGRLRQVRQEDEASRVPIDVHLVVSCGMQIQQPSVVAKAGGIVFNCDGQYSKRDTKASPDDKCSIFTGSRDAKGHTQMTVVTEEASMGTERDAGLVRPQDVEVVTAPLRIPSELELNVSQIEAYGAGEVHVYSKYPLP